MFLYRKNPSKNIVTISYLVVNGTLIHCKHARTEGFKKGGDDFRFLRHVNININIVYINEENPEYMKKNLNK